MLLMETRPESKFKSFFAEARWLNQRRLIAYPRIFVTLYAIAFVVVLAASSGGIVLGKPVGTDFMMMWASGKMVNEGRAAEAQSHDHEPARPGREPLEGGLHVHQPQHRGEREA